MTARQAAEDCASRVPNVEEYTDIIELAIAEATKPLVEMIEELVSRFRSEGTKFVKAKYLIDKADNLLAKAGK